MSAKPRVENAPLASFGPEGEPLPGKADLSPEIQQAETYIEPGGMVDIALRELGAKLVREIRQESSSSPAAGLPTERTKEPSPDAPSSF